MTTPSPARLAKLAPALLSVVQRLHTLVGPNSSVALLELRQDAAKLEASAYAEPRAVKVIIERDSDPTDPREWEPFGRIIHWHRRYDIGHGAEKIDREAEDDWLRDAAVKLPIYMYDHSGVTIATAPFGCRWDSGQVGWIYVTHEDIRKGKVTLEQAEKILQGEIKLQDQYIQGEVYGVRIMDEDGDEVSACWGFYGDDWKDNGIMDHVPAHLRDTKDWIIKP